MLMGCGGDAGGNMVASTKITLAEQSGMGPSPLDPLLGEAIELEVELAEAAIGYDTVETCKWTVHSSAAPIATATGVHAAIVQTEILDRLPDWNLRLALCDNPDQSTVTLLSDNGAGLAVTAGCLGLPPSAMVHDGDGHPRWTDFSANRCDGSVYDQLHGRLFTGRDFTMTFKHR
jgi:hypothetical protein